MGSVFWLLATLALTAAVHYAAILLYPSLLVWGWRRALARRGGTNCFLHGRPPTPEDRHYVRLASPDLAYSAAAFDLSEGPLRIRAPVADQYSSVSLYAANTDNFFVVNDLQVDGVQFDFVVVGPKSTEPDVADVPVVRAPGKTGIVLLRYLVVDAQQLEAIEPVRQQASCALLKADR